MKANLEEFPVPANIDKVLRLDNTFKSLLKKELWGSAIIDMDKDWELVRKSSYEQTSFSKTHDLRDDSFNV